MIRLVSKNNGYGEYGYRRGDMIGRGIVPSSKSRTSIVKTAIQGTGVWDAVRATPSGNAELDKANKDLKNKQATVKKLEKDAAIASSVATKAPQSGANATKAANNVKRFAGFGTYAEFGFMLDPSYIQRAKEQAYNIPSSRSEGFFPNQWKGGGGGILSTTIQRAKEQAYNTDMIPAQVDEGLIQQPQDDSSQVSDSSQDIQPQDGGTFDIEGAKSNVIQMKQDIQTIKKAIIDGKALIAQSKQQIANGRRQVAAI